MKKSFILALICIMSVMLCLSPLTCFATEVSDETEAVSLETALEDNVVIETTTEAPTIEETTVKEPSVYHTLYSRVLEYFNENKTEILCLAGDGLLLIAVLIVKKLLKKNAKEMAADLKIVKGDAAGTASAQTSVVGAVNNMIDGYNDMRGAYEKYEAVEDDRNKLVGAVMVQNTAILDILSIVYVHNKNIPQGVKDLVTLKYVNCQKALGDDETLKAVVTAVREKIEGYSDNSSESTDVAHTVVMPDEAGQFVEEKP